MNEEGDLSLKPRGAPIRLGYKLLGQTLCPPEKQGEKEREEEKEVTSLELAPGLGSESVLPAS